jgi:hypothetical protein
MRACLVPVGCAGCGVERSESGEGLEGGHEGSGVFEGSGGDGVGRGRGHGARVEEGERGRGVDGAESVRTEGEGREGDDGEGTEGTPCRWGVGGGCCGPQSSQGRGETKRRYGLDWPSGASSEQKDRHASYWTAPQQ